MFDWQVEENAKLARRVFNAVSGPNSKRLLSLPEIPSALELLSFQQVGERLVTNDDFISQRSPGSVNGGTAVSFGSGIRALGALAPGHGHAAVATQATVRWR
jgi:hypothetical protein